MGRRPEPISKSRSFFRGKVLGKNERKEKKKRDKKKKKQTEKKLNQSRFCCDLGVLKILEWVYRLLKKQEAFLYHGGKH